MLPSVRIYDGSPRQDWEEVLRSIGAFADREGLKEILFLELEGGFLLQALALPSGGADSDTFGALTKRTYELTDDQVAQLMEEAATHRGTAQANEPKVEIVNYYEQALRVVGAYVDANHARDVFFFEQDGAFVVRLFQGGQQGGKHVLAEFTRDDISQLVSRGPQLRTPATPKPAAAG